LFKFVKICKNITITERMGCQRGNIIHSGPQNQTLFKNNIYNKCIFLYKNSTLFLVKWGK